MQNILWVDDEIDLLRPYLIFLKEKGYETVTATNGVDALELINNQTFDIIFLDENMPGISGLETLAQIKQIAPTIPVVMITKSEAENIMEMAIGNQIADYLTKPVNPSQILLTLKKNLHKREIFAEQTTSAYSTEFSQIGTKLLDNFTNEDWFDIYKRLTFWDLRLNEAQNEMYNLLLSQKQEANTVFAKYISKNYLKWFNPPVPPLSKGGEVVENRPLISPDVFKKRIFPLLDNGENVFLVVFDNFRYDQWKMVQELLGDFFNFDSEELYYAILPTTTQYARNAIFSGLMPLQIKEMFPQFWIDEEDEEGKNNFEEQLVSSLLKRYRREIPFSYHKINNSQDGEKLVEKIKTLKGNPLNVCVLNFIDMLSHARTESKTLRELAHTEAAYRALAVSWFQHSSTFAIFRELAQHGFKVVVTTDHGSIKVDKPIKVIGDKNTSANLRYKVGKSLNYNRKDVFAVTEPKKAMLPSPNVSSSYIFAQNSDFLAYPNNFNYYVSYYKDTFQHGGISMEEMLVPLVVMKGK
ncbi:MAG: PglZ domain-containing protein [Prevotellaceae bacterium]|jgi:DNA-binding response OmpR family regulator|nr:PglZ domain-containing protein [Prevotellaceae bacterium]